jgi:hypothetical protein
MSIFSRIKEAIFGHGSSSRTEKPRSANPSAPSPPPPRPHTSATLTSTSTMAGAQAPDGIPANPANAAWERKVDVEQVLRELAAMSSQKLNWQTSIVDLMKLLGIDSSLENRKELARELGYKGDQDDSAAMNIWLHKRVMQELEKNGGKVPASLVA